LKGLKLIILAAGSSSRMKTPKALLPIPETNDTFIETIVETYNKANVENIIIVTSTLLREELEKLFPKKNIKIITNSSQKLERMYSIFLGIKEINNNDYAFIQDCDNPFITTDIIKTLYKNKNYAHYIVPIYNSKSGHPVLLGPEVIKHIQSLNIITENDTLKNILQKFTRKEVEVSSNTIHININSPELYQQLNFMNT
jgi:CTP:molybdopterin cytidylyltransferase MocA